MGINTLITGANGFIGSHLCQHLVDNNEQVTAAYRRQPQSTNQWRQVIVGELDADTDWSDALEGIDAVVHSAARVHVLTEISDDPIDEFRRVNVDATVNLARQAIAKGVKRFVFISTIGVIGSTSKHPLTESDPPTPKTPYGQSKWEAEEALKYLSEKEGLPLVILRMPLVYGPGVKANFLKLMRYAVGGKPLPFGCVHNQRDFLSVKNLCDAIYLCLKKEQAVGQTYHLCDGHPISTCELVRQLSKAAGTKPFLLPIPRSLMRSGLRMVGRARLYDSVCRSLRIDHGKITRELGWQPPQQFDDALQEVVDWYTRNGVAA
ncbi:MAG: NAD-dependent epimerase/dehydratase family protein [Rickettsiales bacterium]|nr:NAD-dependent epimerase/dehydratase family protein [Rickettsiales bacterium]